MPSTSKSKSSMDKSTPKGGKELPNFSMKPSTMLSNTGPVSPSSIAYNPTKQTFRTLEISSSFFTPPRTKAQFKTIDDSDEHYTSSQGTAAEYDSSSNNSSSSELDDPKDKSTPASPQPETTISTDNDKRDKNRLKNEKKHQRQREKRAQELHERCIAFLTSRKLEALSYQLVAMGFPSERVNMALVLNKGRMEDCVAWLLQDEDDEEQQVPVNLEDKSSAAVDITDELLRITKMEVMYECSRQDVERAVVACEGNLLKAEETLKAQRLAAVMSANTNELKINDKEATPTTGSGLMKDPIEGQEGREYNLSKIGLNPTSWLKNHAAPVDGKWSFEQESWFDAMRGDVSLTLPGDDPRVIMQRPKEQQVPWMQSLTSGYSNLGNEVSLMGSDDFFTRNSLPVKPLSSAELLAAAWWSSRLWENSFPGSSSFWDGLDTRGSTPNPDYMSIDWSMDLTSLSSSGNMDVLGFMGRNAIKPGGIFLSRLPQPDDFLADKEFGQSALFRGWTDYARPPSL